MGDPAVTVVLCTYNRAQLLGDALDFEPRQGVAHARNAGIAAAGTDGDWVRVIKRTFDAHAEVVGLGGRILPIWPSTPPAWLARRHWVGPLALQDYGDEPFIVDAGRPLCLVGANCAFRAGVIARLGGFSPDYKRSGRYRIPASLLALRGTCAIRLRLAGVRRAARAAHQAVPPRMARERRAVQRPDAAAGAHCLGWIASVCSAVDRSISGRTAVRRAATRHRGARVVQGSRKTERIRDVLARDYCKNARRVHARKSCTYSAEEPRMVLMLGRCAVAGAETGSSPRVAEALS
jgi:hypothetical protein